MAPAPHSCCTAGLSVGVYAKRSMYGIQPWRSASRKSDIWCHTSMSMNGAMPATRSRASATVATVLRFTSTLAKPSRPPLVDEGNEPPAGAAQVGAIAGVMAEEPLLDMCARVQREQRGNHNQRVPGCGV